MNRLRLPLKMVALAAALVAGPAFATNGYFPHGYGIRAKGMGGASVAIRRLVDEARRVIEAARAELESKGVTFFGETFDTGVCHMALFADPDGNSLMLHHRHTPR